jgi:hypothetical protein
MEKSAPCRLIVVGGHTRSIGKTQLVCDLISALPEAQWLAGKITQYGHGVCAQNGEHCDCAPTDHVAALDWEGRTAPLTTASSDSARFLLAGAERAFWLRTKQGYLAEGMPLLRQALRAQPENATGARDAENVIIESNSLLQFVKPSLYVCVLDLARADFKDSARQVLDRSDVLVFRRGLDVDDLSDPPWLLRLPARLLRQKPSVRQREGEPVPRPLVELVKRVLEAPPGIYV